ncbi:hypothetical protein CU098_010346 [Rhizopus stolonifer]|uniref:Uncharacterized protein n=1 Tax=Rhizopus stolonifer TaxID=4846 RepID=A0A367KDB8_RHIST|nr:hypothetical protein CU098_010346 [Rhizopus stolonifer]
MSSIAAFITFSLIVLTHLFLLYYYLPERLPPYDPLQYGLLPARPKSRKFTSEAVEEFLVHVEPLIKDRDLYILLQNCLPNTLDTTIEWFNQNTSDPRAFLITGDIPAMWIRDSSNQIAPYIQFVNQDQQLKDLVFGVIQVQASFLDYDPYANAFLRPWYAPPIENPQMGSTSDQVIPAYDPAIVWESKYELDSIGHFFQLTNDYVEVTDEMSRVLESKDWVNAVSRVFQVIQDQMENTWPSASPVITNIDRVSIENGYRFRRYTDRPTETLGEYGLGGISRKCGLVKSAFRPSDDATTLPYLIPANAQLSVQLKRLSRHIRDANKSQSSLYNNMALFAENTGKKIEEAIVKHGIVNHPVFGQVYAYEVDCFGSHIIMDDANLPSLLSLPVLGFVNKYDAIYQNTRNLILSDWNPWYFEGSFVKGIGGPHTGENMVWPMSLLMQIKTSINESEIRQVLDMVKRIAKETNSLMCESIDANQPEKYTRPWFSWANGLAGSTIMDII